MTFNNSPSAEVLKVFETVPNMYLVLSRDLIILTASDLYLEATLTTREKLVGRHIFEAFPDNPDLPDADGVRNIRASLERVLATHKPDLMAVQHYDVPHPSLPGVFVERYWLPSHTPVLDERGEVSYIIQLATNITETIAANHQLRASQDREIAILAEVERQRAQLEERESLYQVFEQTPAAICLQRGPEHRYDFVNAAYQALFPDRKFENRPVAEALPETVPQGFVTLLDAVYRTGETFFGRELPVTLTPPDGGGAEHHLLQLHLPGVPGEGRNRGHCHLCLPGERAGGGPQGS